MWTLLAAAHAQSVNPFEEADEGDLFRFEEELATVASRYAQTVRKAPSIVTTGASNLEVDAEFATRMAAIQVLEGMSNLSKDEAARVARLYAWMEQKINRKHVYPAPDFIEARQ